MVAPLVVLAVLAVLSGLTNVSDGFSHVLRGALPEPMRELHETEFNFGIAASSTAMALAGILFAWLIYGARVISADVLRRGLAPVHALVSNKYYMDHLYERVLVSGALYRGVSFGLALFDGRVVDGTVNGVARATRMGGSALRLLQSGQLQAYGVAAFTGLLIIVLLVLTLNPL